MKRDKKLLKYLIWTLKVLYELGVLTAAYFITKYFVEKG